MTTTGLIPDRLLSDVKKGDRVLFLGADLPLGYSNAPLSRLKLAVALAESYDLPRGKSWSQTATDYLSRFHNDRQGLITFIRRHNDGTQVAFGPMHRAIAWVGFRAIVTAWYDELLERTLRDAGYTVNRVVRDGQVAYAQEGEREVVVVKLYGCFSDPESLVLDIWDHDALMENLSRKLELATAFCAIRPPLFVGFDLLNPTPRRLYLRASRNMAEHMRRAYAIWPRDFERVKGAWYGKNVEFRRADATAFLEALAVQLPSARVVEKRAKCVDRPPYKFLDYTRYGHKGPLTDNKANC
ncbi:MAG: SIR2 family protein, partial [Anaerolineales bacterium]